MSSKSSEACGGGGGSGSGSEMDGCVLSEHFMLQWDEHRANTVAAFSALRRRNKLLDVTLAAQGRQLQAHKVVLCACSPYFEELITSNPCKHPIVYLKDVEFDNLMAVVEFMYNGSVYITRSQLDDVINIGRSLQVRGIAGIDFDGVCGRNDSSGSAGGGAASGGAASGGEAAAKKRKWSSCSSDVQCPVSQSLSSQGADTHRSITSVDTASTDATANQMAGNVGADISEAVIGGSMRSHAETERDSCSSAAKCCRPSLPTVVLDNSGRTALDKSHSADQSAATTTTTSAGVGADEDIAVTRVACQRARRGRHLQRQPRVKLYTAASSGAVSSADSGSRPASPGMLAASVETVLVDSANNSNSVVGGGGSVYLSVPPSSSSANTRGKSSTTSPTRQLSTPGMLVRQSSAVVATPSIYKQHSTPSGSLQRAASGPTYYMLTPATTHSSTPSSSSLAAVSTSVASNDNIGGGAGCAVVGHTAGVGHQSLPQIMLTHAEDVSASSPLSSSSSSSPATARSHTPSLRDGPAVSCSHCWNTAYSQGRTIRRKTKYMCRDCSASLCIVPCFQEYHERLRSQAALNALCESHISKSLAEPLKEPEPEQQQQEPQQTTQQQQQQQQQATRHKKPLSKIESI